jgi:hypothetical protein
MAILYGTTADGDSLPVEVNEFGQLIAQGLQGQEGPPGPPGVGELPPDPFEGAILGWKDNTLSWLGGVAPLPEGTYGPILSYENGVLTLEEDVSLPYLASIYLSDVSGGVVVWSALSAPISSVLDASFNKSQVWTNGVSPSAGDFSFPPTGGFDGNIGSYSQTKGNNVTVEYTWDPVLIADNITINPSPDTTCSCTVYFEDSSSQAYTTAEFQAIGGVIPAAGKYCIGFRMAGQSSGGRTYLSDVKIDGLILVNTGLVPALPQLYKLNFISNLGLSDFSVGDEVQPGVAIASIDASPTSPSMTVEGGTWSVGEKVFGPDKSGLGTVQTTTGNAIILREDNREWKAGLYVTNSDQNLAIRYVYANEEDLFQSFVKRLAEK